MRYESPRHRTVRIITEMYPPTVVNGILQDHPDGIDHFQIGIETTLWPRKSTKTTISDMTKCLSNTSDLPDFNR